MKDTSLNVARRLTAMAEARPNAVAVVEPLGYDALGKRQYRHVTFRELDRDSDLIARGLRQLGVPPGARLALLVRPGIDFISLVFGLFKAGAVAILIDPGMGRRNLIRCLADAQPEGFVAIPIVHAIRVLLPGRFPKARFNVTVCSPACPSRGRTGSKATDRRIGPDGRLGRGGAVETCPDPGPRCHGRRPTDDARCRGTLPRSSARRKQGTVTATISLCLVISTRLKTAWRWPDD